MPKPAITRVSSMIVDPNYNINLSTDVNTSQGFYVPQLTTTQINALAAPTLTNGGIVYNTTTNTFQFYQSGAWVSLTMSAYQLVNGTNYIMKITDVIVGVIPSGATRTITLPNATLVQISKIFSVKDVGGTAGTNPIAFGSNGGTIDGNVTAVTISTNYGFVHFFSDGTNWFTI